MSSSLSSYIATPLRGVGTIQSGESSDQQAERLKLLQLRAVKSYDKEVNSSAKYWSVAAIVGLHVALISLYANRDQTSPVPIAKHEVAIEFIKPEIEPPPPPPVEPPKPPPPPKVQKAPPPPALRTPVATQDIAPDDIVVQENTQAPVSSGPVVAAEEPTPPAPPPAPVVEEPVTEASANAGYLKNPPPEYPARATQMGWGGTVILRVRVSADGSTQSVSVKKSSGHKVLDDSAVAAVKKWTFVPSKRGSTPIDGWATVPIIFNSEQ
ncbi:energy transducer TonB [Methylotenera versatilis]|uniref:energy transducer TonB n=1 Tax=Methylotenera versatilis TaxID=1055487 RepID=UPI00064915B2|nr:energy transducer TonB [Methylotenera versatilis]